MKISYLSYNFYPFQAVAKLNMQIWQPWDDVLHWSMAACFIYELSDLAKVSCASSNL